MAVAGRVTATTYHPANNRRSSTAQFSVYYYNYSHAGTHMYRTCIRTISPEATVEGTQHRQLSFTTEPTEKVIRLGQLEKPQRLNSKHKRGDKQLKEWECVQVSHHKDIGKVIENWQKNGWRLHAYQATGTPTAVNHYLLFEKGE